MIILVIVKMQNEFDKEIKYKLFRTINEILHPTISKKNISDYRIIIEESILPVRVFYPKKVTGIHNIIIYIHGNGKVTKCTGEYSNICKNIVNNTNYLLIAIDYEIEKNEYKKIYEEIYNTVKYLYNGLKINGIESDNIVLMGDSTGANIITGINYMNHNEIEITKEILFYPVLKSFRDKKTVEALHLPQVKDIEKYFNFISPKEADKDDLLNPLSRKEGTVPKTLIITGKVDVLMEDAKDYYEKFCQKTDSKYIEFPFSAHGFLKKIDDEYETELFKEVNQFLK